MVKYASRRMKSLPNVFRKIFSKVQNFKKIKTLLQLKLTRVRVSEDL